MIRAVLGILALFAFPLAVFAQAVPATATGGTHPYSLGGNTYTFSGAQANAANAAKYSYAPAANGAIYTTNVTSIPGASGGAAVPVTVKGSISKAAAAAALGRFALKATGVIGFIGLGVGLYDLGKELGFTLSDNNGALGVTQSVIDPALCYAAPCYKWPHQAGGYTESKSVASRAWCDYYRYPNTSCTFVVQSDPSQIIYYVTATGYGTANSGVRYGVSGGSVLSPNNTPSTPQAFTDAVAAKSAWPPESAIARAVRDAVKSGESVAVDPVGVTGPATSPGPRTVTNNGTSTTTSQTTNNYNYSGNTVSVTNITTSSTVNNTSGATEAQTTTTTEPVAEPIEEADSASDTPLVSMPTLYVRKYPDGLTGVWNTKKAELLATPLLQLTSNLQPTIAAPSGYPSWPISVVIGHWNFGTYDVSPASYVWDFLKVCTIIGALFLARALIFGG